MKQYNVGDKVWVAHCEIQKIEKPCSICFGKRKVTLILGDGSEVILPCEYCGKGFNAPSGVITEYEFIAEAIERIITEVHIRCTTAGGERKYHSGYYHFEEDEVFDTREEALAKCAEVVKKQEEEQTTCTERIKANQRKNFSWNAGYHLRNAKKDRASAEYHERMAILCKGRARQKEEVKDD